MFTRLMILGAVLLAIGTGCTKKKSSSSGSSSSGTPSATSSASNGVYSTSSMSQSSPGSLPSGLTSGNWNNPQLKALFNSSASNYQDDGVTEVIDFNGRICWVGFSSQLYQGRNLWCRENGVNFEANTNPNGDDGSNSLTVIGTNLYFVSATAVGYKLFKYDGSTVSQISDVNPGLSDDLYGLTKIGSLLYLVISHPTDSTKANKGYVYDGSQLSALAETNPGTSDGVYGFAPYKTGACYYSTVPQGEYRIFCHSSSGVQAVPELNSSGSEGQGELLQVGNDLYYYGYDGNSFGIFKYNGTSSSLVYSGSSVNSLFLLGSKILFSYYNQTSLTQEFGMIDTTTNQFSAPFDLCSGCSDNVSSFKAVPGGVTFIATSSLGQKLFFWNGSSAVPTQWSDTAGSGNNDNLSIYAVSGSAAYFSAYSGTETRAYYRNSNGSLQMLPETLTGEDDSASVVIPVGSDIYYISRSSVGTKLFYYNGSTSVAVSNSSSGGDEYVERIFPYQTGVVYLSQAATGKKLFYFNGTTVTQISNTYPNGDDQPEGIVIKDSNLYFAATINVQGHRKVFHFNGSTTVQVPSSISGGDDSPEQLTIGTVASGNHLFFVANSLNSSLKPVKRLFEYDGNHSQLLTQFNENGDDVAFISPAQSGVYFLAREQSRAMRNGLYFYDGSSVVRISAHNSLDNDMKVELMKVCNNRLYFYGDLSGSWKLYEYDGSNVFHISNANPSGNDQVTQIVELNGSVVYSANDGSVSRLYYWDGSNSYVIPESDNPTQLLADGSNLYFNANPSGYYKLFRFDGTQNAQISNTNPSSEDSIGITASMGGSLYFSALNGTQNRIHSFDGTAVTEMSSILPGVDLKVMSLVVQNGYLYFSTYYQGKGLMLQYQP